MGYTASGESVRFSDIVVLWAQLIRLHRSEYVTILSIMICMTIWDFVIGVLFGIVVSCKFLALTNYIL